MALACLDNASMNRCRQASMHTSIPTLIPLLSSFDTHACIYASICIYICYMFIFIYTYMQGSCQPMRERYRSYHIIHPSPLKKPGHKHTILFVLRIWAYCGWQVWCPFTHRLRGEKVLTWTLVPWISCHTRICWRRQLSQEEILTKKWN